jgi:ABC-type oligopeptide transport system substrate-binding subunit
MKMVRQWRYILLATLAIVALAVLAACSSSDDSTSTPTPKASGGLPADAAPDAQQLLTINTRAEPSSIDPQVMLYTYEASITNNTFLNLFDQDPTTSQLTPNAASVVPSTTNGGVAADGVTYTIKLKPGLKWSDGTAVTAADFVYGIIRGYNLNVSGAAYGGFITGLKGATEALALDPKSATYVADVNAKLKDSVVAVDATTLKLVAAQPSVSFLSNFILPITAAVKQSNVEALGDSFGQAAGAAQMVTDGPFTIKEWVAKDHMTLARNPNYTAGPLALLKEVKFTFIADQNQAYNALQAGQSDEVSVPPSSYPGVKSDPTVHQEQEFGTRWLYVDVTIPPWNNKDFVIAINQATDRATIGRDVYFGLRQPWAAPCAAAVLDCDPTLFTNLEFNLANAKASALKAYPDGNIPAITLEGLSDPTTQTLIQTLQSQWQQISGVHVTLSTTDQATIRSDMKKHISGTQISGWSMDYADPTDLWGTFTTASLGATNTSFYSRPAYDTLEAQQDTQTDPTVRKATLKQLQQSLAADPPVINMFVALRTDQFSAKVKGIVTSPFDYEVIGDQFLEDMYIGK